MRCGGRYDGRPIPGKGYSVQVHSVSCQCNSSAILSRFDCAFRGKFVCNVATPSKANGAALLGLVKGVLGPTRKRVRASFGAKVTCMFRRPRLLDRLAVTRGVTLPLTTCLGGRVTFRRTVSVLRGVRLSNFRGHFPGRLDFKRRRQTTVTHTLACPSPLLLVSRPFGNLSRTLDHHVVGHVHRQRARGKRAVLFASRGPKRLRLFTSGAIHLSPADRWRAFANRRKVMGRGMSPLPSSSSAPVSPFGVRVVILRVRDPEPIPYLGVSGLAGQSGLN